MIIDVNELCMIQLMGYRNYFATLTERVHIYVHATKQFLHDNPHMASHVTENPSGPLGIGFVILNISDNAVRNIHRDGNYLVFDSRFQGKSYSIRVILGDIFGVGPAGIELMLLDPGAIVLSSLCGSMLLRPYDSLRAEVDEVPVVEPEKESKRPTLTVVK